MGSSYFTEFKLSEYRTKWWVIFFVVKSANSPYFQKIKDSLFAKSSSMIALYQDNTANYG